MQRPRANVLDVVVGTIATDTPFATYRLGISGPMSKVVVTGSRGDGYEGVVRGMLRALAVLGFRGEVRVRYLSDLDRLDRLAGDHRRVRRASKGRGRARLGRA